MKSRLFLDVVVRKGTAILELLASEDETLLVWRDTLLVLNPSLHGLDGVRRLNLECDSLAGQGLDEDLHTATKTEDKVKGRLLLDVVVGESTAVLKLLSSEDETLLVRGNTLLVLNLALDGLDRVGGLDFKGDSLSSQGLDKDLHTTTQTED